MDRLSIEEAASRLGVSIVTIRRRVRKGELASEKEETPSGFRYVVLLPSREELQGRGEDDRQQEPFSMVGEESRTTAALQGTIDILKEELAQRNGEIERLLTLLSREQEIVRAAQLQLPARTEERTREDVPEDALSVRSDQGDDQRDRGLLSRLRRLIRGS